MKAVNVIWLLVAVTAACKDKPHDLPAPAPAGSAATSQAEAAKPVTPGPGAAAPSGAPTIALASGQSFEPSADLTRVGANPVTWKATPTDTVMIGFVFEGAKARAMAATGSGAPIEIAAMEFNAAYSGSYGAVVQPDGKVVLVITSNGGSEDPGFVAAWRVAWDATAKKPIVESKGQWAASETNKIAPWAKLPAP